MRILTVALHAALMRMLWKSWALTGCTRFIVVPETLSLRIEDVTRPQALRFTTDCRMFLRAY